MGLSSDEGASGAVAEMPTKEADRALRSRRNGTRSVAQRTTDVRVIREAGEAGRANVFKNLKLIIMPNEKNQAAWNAAANNITQASQMYAAAKLNKKTKDWNRDNMNIQRQWALDDWNMQNEYNSPENQMARLEAAGLNPNLIYGHGTVDNNSAGVKAAQSGSWNPKIPDAPRFENPATAYLDMETRQVTLDNARAQGEVLRENANYIRANTARTIKDGDLKGFELGFKQDTRDVSIEGLNYQNQQRRVGISYTLQAEESLRLRTTSDLKTAVEIRENYAWQRAESESRTAINKKKLDMMADEWSLIKEKVSSQQNQNVILEFQAKMKKEGFEPGTQGYWDKFMEVLKVLK